MTKPTMELVELFASKYAMACVATDVLAQNALDEADILRAEISQRLEAMERDAARFVAFFSAFAGDNKRFLTAVYEALPENTESLDYIRAAIDAAMAEGEG